MAGPKLFWPVVQKNFVLRLSSDLRELECYAVPTMAAGIHQFRFIATETDLSLVKEQRSSCWKTSMRPNSAMRRYWRRSWGQQMLTIVPLLRTTSPQFARFAVRSREL